MSAFPDCVIGVDFGTDSVRALLVAAATGEELCTSVFYYPRWKQQLYCDAGRNRFRQHPLDYVEGLQASIRGCIAQAGPAAAAAVRAISVDTTGSTPVAIDAAGLPLALSPHFTENPNAMFVLWKDHTAVAEAAEINRHARQFDTDYLAYVGGTYSSEWFWAKALHVLREDEAVRAACHSWVEHCDWIPFLLTGGGSAASLKRGVCAAGHKGLWSAQWNGMPPEHFFASLDPLLAGFRDTMAGPVFTSDQRAGTLSPEWARRLGLHTEVVVGIGAFDCHMGAVGGQIEPYYLSKVMGTSTCDMLVIPLDDAGDKTVRGICGQVPGSIIPGMLGLEAGQSAFGDAFAWLRDLLAWPLRNLQLRLPGLSGAVYENAVEEATGQLLATLGSEAALLVPEDDDELALDWLNGRRTPDANQLLTGAFTGLRLRTDAPRLFRALAEGTAFGARAIVERFRDEGIPVRGLIGLGGVAQRSPFLMQLMCDVLQMPIRIHSSEQTCAAGAAMFAATAAGLYPDVEAAMRAMGRGFETTYTPDVSRAAVYDRRYGRYLETGAFAERMADRSEAREMMLSL